MDKFKPSVEFRSLYVMASRLSAYGRRQWKEGCLSVHLAVSRCDSEGEVTARTPSPTKDGVFIQAKTSSEETLSAVQMRSMVSIELFSPQQQWRKNPLNTHRVLSGGPSSKRPDSKKLDGGKSIPDFSLELFDCSSVIRHRVIGLAAGTAAACCTLAWESCHSNGTVHQPLGRLDCGEVHVSRTARPWSRGSRKRALAVMMEKTDACLRQL